MGRGRKYKKSYRRYDLGRKLGRKEVGFWKKVLFINPRKKRKTSGPGTTSI